jgi:hypothetical protein
MLTTTSYLKKMQTSLIVGLILLFILTLWIWSQQPIIAFEPWISWYNTYDPEKKYRCMPPRMMAYYYGPSFMFQIAKLFSRNKGNQDWYNDYLMSLMRSFGRGIRQGDTTSVMVPRNICISLVPDSSDPPDAASMIKKLYIPKGYSVDCGGSHLDAKTSMIGAWPSSIDDWRVLMLAETKVGGWGCKFSLTKENVVIWDTDSADAWQSAKTNFLWKFYAIPYNSSLVIGFVTQATSYGKIELFPNVMEPLLGLNNLGQGGWYGMLLNGEDWGGYGSLEVQAYVFDEILKPSGKNNAPCTNIPSIIGGGVSFGLLAGGLLLKLFESETIALPLLAISTVASAFAGGGLTALAQGC